MLHTFSPVRFCDTEYDMSKKKPKNKKNGGASSKKNLKYKKGRCTKRRDKDLDQIQDEMKTFDASKLPIEEDLPGLGQYYCLTCARYFINKDTLDKHCRTKPHKRKLKLALEKPYSQKEAEAAAGMAPSR